MWCRHPACTGSRILLWCRHLACTRSRILQVAMRSETRRAGIRHPEPVEGPHHDVWHGCPDVRAGQPCAHALISLRCLGRAEEERRLYRGSEWSAGIRHPEPVEGPHPGPRAFGPQRARCRVPRTGPAGLVRAPASLRNNGGDGPTPPLWCRHLACTGSRILQAARQAGPRVPRTGPTGFVRAPTSLRDSDASVERRRYDDSTEAQTLRLNSAHETKT